MSEPFVLGPAQLEACQQLSIEAGWNQTQADWSFILEHGLVLGIANGERLVASAGVVPYGKRFGWICMVLVTASERRKGLASRLMSACMQWLADRGAIAGLDATPAGREVYRQLGFCDVYPITRLQRPVEMGLAGGQIDATNIHLIEAADLDRIAAFDRESFGENRQALLAEWRRRVPSAALLARGGDEIEGCVFARDGRVATQIGPLIARDAATAISLLRACLGRLSGPVFIDVPDRHRAVRDYLEAHGFSVQRTFTRMLLGRAEPLDRPERIVALAGPEFG